MYLLPHLLRALATRRRVFVTSDPHIGHENILKYCPSRPWKTIGEMNQAIVVNWNSVVGPRDTVLVLGDFCLGEKKNSFPFLQQLNGEIHLYSGNHDHNSIMYFDHKEVGFEGMAKNPERWAKTLVKLQRGKDFFLAYGVHEVLDMGMPENVHGIPYQIGPLSLKLHHFPYQGDHKEKDRFACYRPSDCGNLLLHGHVHDLWKFNGRMINVGMDVWNYRPVEIRKVVREWWKQASKEDRQLVLNTYCRSENVRGNP